MKAFGRGWGVPNPREISGLIRTIGETRDRRAILPLIKVLNILSNRTENAYELEADTALEAAAMALGTIGDPASVVSLELLIMEDPRPRVREGAVIGLSKIQHPSIIDPLRAALEDDHVDVRKEAARALGDVLTEDDIDILLLSLLHDESIQVQATLLESIEKLGPTSQSIPILERALEQIDLAQKGKSREWMRDPGPGGTIRLDQSARDRVNVPKDLATLIRYLKRQETIAEYEI